MCVGWFDQPIKKNPNQSIDRPLTFPVEPVVHYKKIERTLLLVFNLSIEPIDNKLQTIAYR